MRRYTRKLGVKITADDDGNGGKAAGSDLVVYVYRCEFGRNAQYS